MRNAGCAVLCMVLWSIAALGADFGTIEGTVRLIETGQPMAGVRVLALEAGAETITDRDGRFTFRRIVPGQTHLVAQLEEFRSESAQLVNVVGGEQVEVELQVTLAPETASIVVSASDKAELASGSFAATQSLTSFDLARAENVAAGLGEVLGNQPGTGIAQRGFGPGSSRPVIRGFDGDRVLIMTDGLRTGSISATSGDHAETFNPLSFDRLEVVKGPATLLYGSNAMGGVVNAVSDHAGFHSHPDGWQGYVQGSAGTANALGGGAAGIDYAKGPWRFWLGANGLRTGDYQAPGQEIENSRTQSTNGYGGFGWFGERGFVSFGVRANDAAYGVPFAGDFHGGHEEEGHDDDHGEDHDEEGEDHDEEGEDDHDEEELRIDLEMRQQAYQVNWGLRNLGSAIDSFVMKLAYSTYVHEEIEFDGDERNIGTRFDNDQLVYRGVFEQARRGPLSGRFGFWGMNREYSASGEEALSPPVDQDAFALFALEELDFERVKLQFGGRLETSLYNPAFAERAHGHEEEEEHEGEEEGEGHEEEEGFPDAVRRRFTGASAAIGAQVDLWRGGVVVGNFSHSYRAPALEELYNLGPHVGTLTFEVGDPGLKAERGNGVDVSVRQRAGRVDGEVNLFYYDFDNFVFPFATGEEEEGLPVVNFVQRDSRFMGAESRLGFALRDDLRLNLGMDFVDAQETVTNTPLPRIPPLRGRVGFDFRRGGFRVRPELVLANRQSQTFGLETPTAGYAVTNLRASYTVPGRRAIHQFSANVFNVGDRLYRNHSSFIKDLAPELGRGVRVSYMVRFF